MRNLHRDKALTVPSLLLMAAGSWSSGCGGDADGSEAFQRVVEQAIGPDGGTITSGDGRLTLTFPEGAIPSEESIVIETLDSEAPPAPYADRNDVGAAYDVRPNGLTFPDDQPVSVSFEIDTDPVLDDGRIAVPLSALATRGPDGTPEAFSNLVQQVNPDDGSIQIEGVIDHFTPIVVVGGVQLEGPEFVRAAEETGLVVNGVPEELPANETFTAQAILSVDFERSPFDAVENARYEDGSSDPLTTPDPNPREMPSETSPAGTAAFVVEVEYGCIDQSEGSGFYVVSVGVEGVRLFGEELEGTYRLGARRSVTCAAPVDDPNGDDVSVAMFPGANRMTPPTTVANPEGTLGFPDAGLAVGVLGNDGVTTVKPLNSDGQKIEPSNFTADGDFINDIVAVSDGDPETERDAVMVAGVGGVTHFQSTDFSGLISGSPSTEPTFDLDGFDGLNDDGVDDSYASAGADGVRFFRPSPSSSGFMEDRDVRIELSDFDGATPVSVWTGPGGFQSAGDFVIVLTQADPSMGELSSALWECFLEGDPPEVTCNPLNANIGDNALRVTALNPNAEGDMVIALSLFGERRLEFLFVNTMRFNNSLSVNGSATVDEVMAVTPSLAWDPDSPGSDVVFAAGDTAENELVGGRLAMRASKVEATQRIAAPPATTPSGEPCEEVRAEHVDLTSTLVKDRLRLLFTGSCMLGSDVPEPGPGSLFLLSFFKAFGGL